MIRKRNLVHEPREDRKFNKPRRLRGKDGMPALSGLSHDWGQREREAIASRFNVGRVR